MDWKREDVFQAEAQNENVEMLVQQLERVRRAVQGVRLEAGRESVLQQHSGADRGAHQSGAVAKRLKLEDGSIFNAKMMR